VTDVDLSRVWLVDPAIEREGPGELVVRDGVLASVTWLEGVEADGIDPSGVVVAPGFVDLHAHLREPGNEDAESIATGLAAAAHGGFTTVCAMPNTNPVNDNANVTTYILDKAREANLARVYPIGAVSRGSNGELLADIGDLRNAGCVAITDDGHPDKTAILLRRALEYAGMFGMPVIEHCEDPSLKGDAVAHEGYYAASLGLRGMPGACEALGVERGALLAELTGSAFHVAHMSARASLRAVRKAKEAGLRVTCEVAPHHFTLTDEALSTPVAYDTNTKMNPPLREAADRDAMLEGIGDGSVDAIATDHAPHHYDEKHVEYDRAPFGIVGLETAVPLSLDRLVHGGRIRLSRLVELLSVNPARILNVPGGTLSEGAPADITIIAPDLKVKIEAAKLRSRSKNTPFDGWELRGGVAATLVGGRPLYVNAEARISL
jgi:dihydroorotase